MTRKKNKFWNFWFSCMPGAGQMYQGFMKKGVSIMLLFWGMIALIAYLGIDEMLFCLPVIWFYAFFDGIHTNSLPDEIFMQIKDEYVLINDDFGGINLKKLRIPAAILLIAVGAYSMLRIIVDGMIEKGMLYWGSATVHIIYNMVPQAVFSIVIILLGLYLILGKHEALEKDVDIKDTASAEENAFLAANGQYWEEEKRAEQTETENVVQEEEGENV